MRKNDIHIGPCATDSKYRGQKIYPYVISRIVKDYSDANFYMIIDDKNISSQRGVYRAGFKKIAKLEYDKKFRIYRISQALNKEI